MDSTLFVFVPFGICALVMLVVVGSVGYWTIQRFRHTRSPQGRAQLVEQARQWVATERSQLLPWHDAALTDVAASYSFQWHAFVVTHMHGTIQAITSSRPIIAFYGLEGPGLRYVCAGTTAHCWEIEQHAGRLDVRIDDDVWGAWHNGKLFDAHGSMIGEAQISRSTWHTQNDGYDVLLHDRVIGTVSRQPHRWITGTNDSRPLVRPAAPITDDEQMWLLTVALVDVTSTALSQSTSTLIGPSS